MLIRQSLFLRLPSGHTSMRGGWRALLAVFAMLVGLLVPACGTDVQTGDDVFDVSAPPTLFVNITAGALHVKTTATGSVKLHTVLRNVPEGGYSVTVRRNNSLVIDAPLGKGFLGINQHRSVDILAEVPFGTHLQVRLDQGDILVEGARSRFARSVPGTPEPGGRGGPEQEAEAGVRILDSIVVLKGGNGSITVTDFRGYIDAATTNGSIDFTGEVNAGPSPNRLETRKGNVKAKLLGALSLRLDASTEKGTVEVTLPMNDGVEVSDTHVKGGVGSVGENTPGLVVRTGAGVVTVE